MSGILLSARLVLVAVFLVAGLAKLADRDGAVEATKAFGAPSSIADALSSILIAGELAAAGLLVPSATARVGAGLAALLLLTFCAGITRSMLRGEAPDCHCFGQLHSAPAGPKTLARNALLSALAGFVITGGAGTSATAWVGHLSELGTVVLVAGVVLAGVVVAAGVLALSMLRRHGELLLRVDALEQALVEHGVAIPTPSAAALEGLPVGTPAPAFELPDLRHRRVSLRSLGAHGQPVLLVFTDPGCGPCTALLPQIAAWQHDLQDSLRVALISTGNREANAAHAREHDLTDVLLQRNREISERFEVNGTPSAVLIDGDGVIASPVHAGADAIAALVASQIEAPVLEIHRHEPVPSGPAPDLPVRTLDGAEVMLSSQLSGTTAILFWNPACGFCERMLEELRAFAEAPPAGSPRLLLISAGDAAANRAMGIDASILLDQSFAAGNAFGAAGTPSAVLVDGDGQIASAVAVGADAVLALLGAEGALRAA